MSPNRTRASNQSSSGTRHPALTPLERLIGDWTTEATHPALPGVVVSGTAASEWLEGERFIIQRTRNDHPDFPDAISIIGFTDRDRVDGAASAPVAADTSAETPPLTLHYFDSRGVFRVYDFSTDDTSIRYQRLAPGFSQRFTGTFTDAGDTIVGLSQLCRDDVRWEDDLRITFRRQR